MPTNHIISRIKSIEDRIAAIQKMGQIHSKNIEQKPKNNTPPDGSSFSEILDEVMKSKHQSDLNILDSSNNSLTPDNLLGSKVDTLMEIYKQQGQMPTSQPKPIMKNTIKSNNPGTWDSIVVAAGNASNIDPKLIHAVIQAESAYNPQAVSRVGAEGLMQLMPYTAERIGVTDSFDPKQNIFGGAKVLREMLDRYDGDLIKALAAYNAGPDAVDKANGIPNYKETKEYVPRVLNYYYNLRDN